MFARRGIDTGRIILSGRTESRESHLREYDSVDIALDTFPYNGTTTTCEALWMGVPVVTFAGDRHASRVGTSLLNAAGLAEYAVNSIEEYIEKAVSLAGNRGKLSELRQTLRQKVAQSQLCDAKSFTLKLEKAYLDMCGKLK
jgi:predicted O-linked N-acetylglucosamine transferase (SPINDLY family)